VGHVVDHTTEHRQRQIDGHTLDGSLTLRTSLAETFRPGKIDKEKLT